VTERHERRRQTAGSGPGSGTQREERREVARRKQHANVDHRENRVLINENAIVISVGVSVAQRDGEG
jgi:hypothetical protein